MTTLMVGFFNTGNLAPSQAIVLCVIFVVHVLVFRSLYVCIGMHICIGIGMME